MSKSADLHTYAKIWYYTFTGLDPDKRYQIGMKSENDSTENRGTEDDREVKNNGKVNNEEINN